MIRAAHTGVEHAAHNFLEHAMGAGDALIQAKKQVGHGGWLKWLRDRCNLSEDTAERYMLLARHRQQLEANSARVRNLSFNAALRLIKQATPSASSKVPAQPKDAPAKVVAPTAAGGDIGPASAGELARLCARIEELQNDKRRLEIEAHGLRSEIDELKAAAAKPAIATARDHITSDNDDEIARKLTRLKRFEIEVKQLRDERLALRSENEKLRQENDALRAAARETTS
jgi:hypothetical protein